MQNPNQQNVLKIPKHIAIIMDGNGRWASRRGLPRTIGHRQGAKAVKRTVSAAGELGVQYLTLFGFSSENWNRPEGEVKELMRLLRYYLRAETAELLKNNLKLKVLGDITAFDSDIQDLIINAETLSENNDGMTVSIALNYGGRQDILNAVRQVAELNTISTMDNTDLQILFEQSLMTRGMPDPDLLIRTSGEERISNFLLWQCAYSELYFTDTLWPDFGKKDLEEAIAAYQARERRFGAIKASKAK
ncbi:MAG: isoprenyl transferase [Alphaproteobacteria bacterium]